MIFARPGTGKTRGALLAAQDWIESKEARRVLVTAPLKVCHNVWRQERDKWEIPLTMGICTGQTEDKNKIIFGDSDVLVVNHDMLQKVMGCNHGCDAMIIDELSLFRSHNGTWQKTARNSGMKMTTGLTGSPGPNHYLGLYGMARAVGLDVFGKNFDKWKKANFYPTDYHGYKWAIFPGNNAPFETIKPYTYVLDDKSVWLPTIVRQPIWIQLPDSVRNYYREMRKTSQLTDDELINEIDPTTGNIRPLLAANAGILANKLRQIAAGFVYDSTGKGRILSSFRVDALAALVEELQGEPLLVAYEWVEQLHMLRKVFPNAPMLGGGSTDDDAVIIRWNAKEYPVLLIHPASAGHGLNMAQGGNSVAWLQPTYNNELYEQTLGRVRRRDQTSAQVFSYELMAENTLDLAVQQVCHQRGVEQDMLWKKFM